MATMASTRQSLDCTCDGVVRQPDGWLQDTETSTFGSYLITGTGINPMGNFWERRRYRGENLNQNTYHYENGNGSRYWKKPDGWSLTIDRYGNRRDDPPTPPPTPPMQHQVLPTPPPSPPRPKRNKESLDESKLHKFEEGNVGNMRVEGVNVKTEDIDVKLEDVRSGESDHADGASNIKTEIKRESA